MTGSKTLFVGALAFALAACGDNNSTMTDSGSGNRAEMPNTAEGTEDHSRGMAATVGEPDSPPGVGLPAENGAQLADGDRKALMAVMEVDRHEIAASDSALAKDVQGEVRAYAETLQRDHTRNLEATRTLLGDTGDAAGREMTTVAGGTATTTAQSTSAAATAGAPDLAEMKRKHDTEREQLDALSGEAFQKAWVDAMVKGHQEALTKLDSELIPGAADARVKAHLQTTRTAIAGHLETARGLQSQAR